jgi:hypothetical protein
MKKYFYAVVITASLIVMVSAAFAGANNDEARKHLVRGMAAIEMAKSNEELVNAAEEFKKATEIAPDMAAAWYNLGQVQTKIGLLKKAIESYRKYIALAPNAEDTQRIKDEIIKLEYRLEQAEKFNSLSGQWISPEGDLALVSYVSYNGTIKLSISMFGVVFPGSSDVWMYDKEVQSPNAYEYGTPTLYLDQRGSKLTGVVEFPGGSKGWCALPPEKNQVEGTLESGRILLRMDKMKFKVVMNSNDTLFSSPKVHCDEVTPTGTMTKEMVLIGPLEKGQIGCSIAYTKSGNLRIDGITAGSPAEKAGLKVNDEITAIDGAELSLIKNDGERIMKLRGKPDSTVQLVVKRTTGKPGLFSSTTKTETLNISVRRTE